MADNKPKGTSRAPLGSIIALSVAIGASLGVALGNLALGIGLGIAFCAALIVTLRAQDAKAKNPDRDA